VGSITLAAWIAHLAFWGLLLLGLAYGELRPKRIALFLTLWIAGLFGLPCLPYGAALFSSFVAALDIALAFIVFKGDVRIT